jgi:hypothetical protein
MPDRHFDFEINNLADVTEHLDALWYEFNQLTEALNSRNPCTNPPDTCGVQSEQQQKRGGKKGHTKYYVKKSKR